MQTVSIELLPKASGYIVGLRVLAYGGKPAEMDELNPHAQGSVASYEWEEGFAGAWEDAGMAFPKIEGE